MAKLRRAACVGLILAAGSAAAAEPYPSRLITIVVPYPAGGTIDKIARDLAEHLRQKWGKPVIVDNKGGGNGIIGSEYVKSSPPDGYKLLVGGGSTHTVGPAGDPAFTYDPIADFTPIAYLGDTPMVLTAGPTMKAADFKQFVQQAKANTKGFSYASVGTSTLLAGTMLKKQAGIELLHINYKQFGQALIDTSRGDVDLAISSLSIVLPNIKQNQVRPLAVTSLQRSKLLPNVPTVAESYPGFEVVIWFGLFGPAGLPEDLRRKIHDEVVAYQRTPGRNDHWAKESFDLRVRKLDEYVAYVKSDYDKWRTVAVDAGLRQAR